MVCEGKVALSYPNLLTVLILVLMEYGLRDVKEKIEEIGLES